jgi:hypothetical protein
MIFTMNLEFFINFMRKFSINMNEKLLDEK